MSSAAPVRVEEVPSDDPLLLLDDPQEWSAFSRESATYQGCWESNVVIEGMHCAACAVTVEDALSQVPGVARAEVSAASRRARIVWRADSVKPSQWMQSVGRVGYRAVPANDVFASERRRQESRTALWRMAVAGFCMMQVMMYAYPAYIARPGDLSDEMEQLLRWASWVLTLPVILFSCGPFFSNALRDLLQRQVSMDLPVALGIGMSFVVSTIGTFVPQGTFGHEVYFDSLTMFVFFLLIGRWLELRLRDQTAGSLEALMNRLPDSVLRRRNDGGFERVALRRLQPGDVVRVLPGEAFPGDGIVLEGSSLVDEALLTGESRPLPRTAGEGVLAGSHNRAAPVLVRIDLLGEQTRFAQIVTLMQSASVDKPQLAQLADRIAKPFLLAVLAAAGMAAVYGWQFDPAHAVMVAVAVLVVTCPCALSLATPAAMLSAAGALARRGILVRRLPAFEALAQVDTVVFDKTGTLTQDRIGLRAVRVRADCTAEQALGLAATVARHSLHPVSRAIVASLPLGQASDGNAGASVLELEEVLGKGLRARVEQEGREVTDLRLGSAEFCGLSVPAGDRLRSHLVDQCGWVATFEFEEQLRTDAAVCVRALQLDGIEVHLLSGDGAPAAKRVADEVGIYHVRSGCSPEEKLALLRALQSRGRQVAMVGDGLNDGPVMAAAHVSFAVGSSVPLAQGQADFVIPGQQLAGVAQAARRARRTLRVVRQNLVWAASYNALCVPMAVAGWLPAWLAGLGMATSALLVVLNALRLSQNLPSLDY